MAETAKTGMAPYGAVCSSAKESSPLRMGVITGRFLAICAKWPVLPKNGKNGKMIKNRQNRPKPISDRSMIDTWMSSMANIDTYSPTYTYVCIYVTDLCPYPPYIIFGVRTPYACTCTIHTCKGDSRHLWMDVIMVDHGLTSINGKIDQFWSKIDRFLIKKWSILIKNEQKWSKCDICSNTSIPTPLHIRTYVCMLHTPQNRSKTGKNGQKRPKTAKNEQKWAKMGPYPPPVCPDPPGMPCIGCQGGPYPPQGGPDPPGDPPRHPKTDPQNPKNGKNGHIDENNHVYAAAVFDKQPKMQKSSKIDQKSIIEHRFLENAWKWMNSNRSIITYVIWSLRGTPLNAQYMVHACYMHFCHKCMTCMGDRYIPKMSKNEQNVVHAYPHFQ